MDVQRVLFYLWNGRVRTDRDGIRGVALGTMDGLPLTTSEQSSLKQARLNTCVEVGCTEIEMTVCVLCVGMGLVEATD